MEEVAADCWGSKGLCGVGCCRWESMGLGGHGVGAGAAVCFGCAVEERQKRRGENVKM